MAEQIEFIDLSDDKKKVLLDILGYDVNENGIVIRKDDGTPQICPFTKAEITFEKASILPWNSSILINTTPLSLSEYFSEYKKLKGENHGH